MQRPVPHLALLRQHEKSQEGQEGNFQEQRVQRANAAEDQRANDPGFCPHRGCRRRAWLRSNLRYLPLDSSDFSFHGAGSLLQNAAVFWPVLGEIRGTRPESVAHRRQYGDQNQHHDHGAQGTGQPQPFQKFHRGIQKIGQQNREQQGDHHAGRVIEEEQDDGRGDHTHAEV